MLVFILQERIFFKKESSLIKSNMLIIIFFFFERISTQVWVSVTPWSAARQAPLSMGFSRQEY